MKTRTILGGLALAAALSAGVATTALAQSDPSSPPTTSSTPATTPAADAANGADAATKGARKDFGCSHQTQINDLFGQRKALLESRLALEKQARQAAVDAHANAWVVRIDNHIAETVKAQTKAAGRAQRFTDWAAKSCTG